MLSLSKHLYRSSNPIDRIYYSGRDASTTLSMTFYEFDKLSRTFYDVVQ